LKYIASVLSRTAPYRPTRPCTGQNDGPERWKVPQNASGYSYRQFKWRFCWLLPTVCHHP